VPWPSSTELMYAYSTVHQAVLMSAFSGIGRWIHTTKIMYA